MKKLVIAFSLLSTVAFAQQAVPEFNLKLNSTELDLVGKALGKLPFEDVATLIQKLRQQIVDQTKSSEPEKK